MTSTIDKTNCNTGTNNEQYDLISVVYHTLEGAVTYEQYVEDAKAAGDSELASFFEELKKTSIYSISAVSIKSSNSIIKIVRFLRIKN